jgi:predicted NAD-dependent protein-ADP-ribosyltransferase YbiA (DUF1768 family)
LKLIDYSIVPDERYQSWEIAEHYIKATRKLKKMATSEMVENDELERLKKECNAMMRYLKKLHREEKDLRQRNEMIAREALLCGFQPDALEPQPSKQRRKAQMSASKSNTTSSAKDGDST